MAVEQEQISHQIQQLVRRLRETRKQGDLPLEANLCLTLGALHEQLAQWSDAYQYHRWDAQICEAMEDQDGFINAIINQAMTLWHWEKTESALRLLRGHLPDTAACLARLLLRQANSIEWRVPREELLSEAQALIAEDDLHLRAGWHLIRGDVEQAEDMLTADDSMETNLLLGQCALARGQAKRAIEEYFDRLIGLERGDGIPDAGSVHCVVYYWLAKAYLSLNDLVLAGETCWLLQSMQSETGITDLKPTPAEINKLRLQIQERRLANPIRPRNDHPRAWLDYARALYQAGRWSDCLAALSKCDQRATVYRLQGECRWRLGAPPEEVCEWLRRSWEASPDVQIALLIAELETSPQVLNTVGNWLLEYDRIAGWSALAVSDPAAREACLAQLAQGRRDRLTAEAPDLKRIRGKDYWEGRRVTRTLKGMLGGDFAMRVRTKKRRIIKKRPMEVFSSSSSSSPSSEFGMDNDVIPVDAKVDTPAVVSVHLPIGVFQLAANSSSRVSEVVEAAYATAKVPMPPAECLELRDGHNQLLLPLDPIPSELRVFMKTDHLLTRYQANCRQHGVTPNPFVLERMKYYADNRLDLSIMELHADDFYLIDLPGVTDLDLSCVWDLDRVKLGKLLERAPQLQSVKVKCNPHLNVSSLNVKIKFISWMHHLENLSKLGKLLERAPQLQSVKVKCNPRLNVSSLNVKIKFISWMHHLENLFKVLTQSSKLKVVRVKLV